MADTKPADTPIAFLGLGVMGYPMAGHLAKAGYPVTVYNRTSAKAERWVDEYGGRAVVTPGEAAREASLVFACVGNDDDLRAVALGDSGAFGAMAQETVFIDHTTASANIARELGRAAAAAGFSFLDAPVSGGEAGAQNGMLTVMVGGDEAAFGKAKAAMDCFSRAVTLMGPTGSGQLTKMVNQICIAGLLQGLAEGVNFSARNGLDSKKVIDVISKGAAQSWQMENRGHTMVDDQFDFGFAVDWMRKDLGICLEQAGASGALLPLTALVDQFYAEVQLLGGGRWDTSSLLRRLTRER